MTQAAHAEHGTHGGHAGHIDLDHTMAMPLKNGKLAMWLFLVTEIMFFTALIGTYLILRSGVPQNHDVIKWPAPHDVHLSELLGAVNTFVLIVSSLTVVLAHHAALKKNFKQATWYIVATTVLGVVFMGIKATEYKAKFAHDIVPGYMGEVLPGMGLNREKQFHNVGMQYVDRVALRVADKHTAEQLTKMVEKASGKELAKTTMSDLQGKEAKGARGAFALLTNLKPEGTLVRTGDVVTSYAAALSPAETGEAVNAVLHAAHDGHEEIHLPPAIPFGNMWASCYFAMTGFHALHVLGGIVIFGVISIMGLMGRLNESHTDMLEVSGLYWHFVDIVWIFLFPLLYLV